MVVATAAGGSACLKVQTSGITLNLTARVNLSGDTLTTWPSLPAGGKRDYMTGTLISGTSAMQPLLVNTSLPDTRPHGLVTAPRLEKFH